MKISVLCTDRFHPVVKRLDDWAKSMLVKQHIVTLVFDKADLLGGDVLFLVSCGQMIGDHERAKYKSTLVLHASDLPKRRGWSPHIWAILDGENEITVSLFEATEPVDTGLIWLKTSFSLEGHELLDEINKKLFDAEILLMTSAINKINDINPIDQIGDPGSYMQKRTPADSEIDPKKSIVEQFDLLRVVDSDRYPAFFYYRGYRYKIKIEKVKSE
jgi:methionyl-tRNA formyltransferase